MADVSATLASWSSTTGSNNPQGTATVGNGVDDNLREVQGVVVRGLSHKGADISSTSTTDIWAVEGLMHDILGTTTINSFGTASRAGLWKILKFEGQLTLTHSASLILPGAGNIVTADGDVAIVFAETATVARVISYQYATNGLVPVGSVMPFAGTTEPAGWLFCYGQAVSRTTYARLFSVLSTVYGTGDGSTTFNLPDLRGRVVAGQDDMGGSSADRLTAVINGDTLGAAGGTDSHTLTASQIPTITSSGSFTTWNAGSTGNGALTSDPSGATGTVTVSSTSTNTGGAAHTNLQPTLVLNYLIKT